MQMTENEILRSYNQAKDKKEQVKILADLNCCSKEDIQKILHLDRKEGNKPNADKKTLLDRLDELDAMIKPLEYEYERIVKKLKKMG